MASKIRSRSLNLHISQKPISNRERSRRRRKGNSIRFVARHLPWPVCENLLWGNQAVIVVSNPPRVWYSSLTRISSSVFVWKHKTGPRRISFPSHQRKSQPDPPFAKHCTLSHKILQPDGTPTDRSAIKSEPRNGHNQGSKEEGMEPE